MACTENPASEQIADFIYRYYSFAIGDILAQENTCADFINNRFVVIHRPLEQVTPLSVHKLGYDTIPNLYTLLDSSSMESAGILRALEQPRLSYGGRQTVIGIADTGIDYQNPLFRSRDESTRILGIWDQTIEGNGLPSDDPLASLSYGTVYTEAQINEALRSSDPLSVVPSTDASGHGTFLAAVAAGGQIPAEDFTGAAPEAKLVIVKLKPAKKYLRDFFLIPQEADAFQENDIMAAVKYLLLTAREYGLPITVLLGLGTNMGSHSGASPLALYLSDFGSISGQIVVVAGGNETGRGHHYFGSVPTSSPYQDVELRVGSKEQGFSLELWSRESELYSVGFLSPSGEEIARIPLTARETRRVSFLLEETAIYVDYTSSESATGSLLILMRFERPTPGVWRIRVYNSLSIRGEYHIWLPVHGFLSEDTFFLRPDPDTTITDPGNAAGLITTAAYNHRTGGLYIHSSRGYSRTGTVKPDLTAPGVDVAAPAGLLPAPSLTDTSLTPRPTVTLTGTSVAAAHTAGAAANLMAWAFTGENLTLLNTPIARSILIRGADRQPSREYPNREWGYGTLNLYNSFLTMRE